MVNDSNLPLVSVVVPTYSRSELLLQALASVDAQTYKNLEIIVVDDNGRNSVQQRETEEKIKSFSHKCERACRYIVREENGGGALARNTGIKASNGEYIAFLDDDDKWLPEKIELQVSAMAKNKKVGLSYAHCREIMEDGSYVDIRRTVNGNALVEQAVCSCIATTSQWVVRREALICVGGFTDSPSKQDGILLYKLLLAGYEILCVPEILSVYNNKSHTRISNSSKALVGEYNLARLLRSTYDLYPLNDRRRIEAAIHYRIGRLTWLRGERIKGGLQLCLSFILAPFTFFGKISRIRRSGSREVAG